MIHVHFHDADWKEDEHPREDGGQFTSGGGSTGGSKAEGETEEKKDYIGTQAHMQELADSVMKQYGLHPVRVEMNDLGADHAIGVSGGRTHINLNSKFFTPENMAKYAKEWDGLTVGADKDDPQKTAAGIILHELGHVAMRQIQGESPEGTRRNKKVKEYDARWQEIEDLAREHWDRQHNGKGQGSPVSAYGQDNPAEFAAEAFVAQHLGTGAGWTAENRASGLPNAKAFWEALIAKGVPAKAQHSWDAAWKEEEHNRGGDPANPGRFSKGGSAGMHAPKAEPSKPASAPTPASEAPEGEARVRKPEGISAQMHKDLGDFGFRYEGVEPHTITEGGRDYTNEMVRYENPNGDTIKFKRGPDEEAIWWEAEFPNFHGPGKPYKTSGYGTVNWIGALPGTKEYRKAHKLKAAEREAYRETTVLSRVRTINQEKYPAHFHVIKQMSAKYDYPVEKFEVAEPDERFYSKVNGRAFMAAGWAEPKTGKIVINAESLIGLNQIVAHEILHQKQFAAEKADKAIKKYIDKNFDRLEADDGLTRYSRDWWANWQTVNKAFEGTYAQKNPDSKQIDAVRARAEYDHARWSAVGETLAEMASKKEGGAAQFTSSYEELYRMINRAYANTREGQREAA